MVNRGRVEGFEYNFADKIEFCLHMSEILYIFAAENVYNP